MFFEKQTFDRLGGNGWPSTFTDMKYDEEGWNLVEKFVCILHSSASVDLFVE